MPANEEHTGTDDTDTGTEDEPEGDDAEDERMLFGQKREETTLFVGSGLGLTRVDVAAAQVGQFSLLDRRGVRCLATDGGVLVVASEGGVLVTAGDDLVETGFGPAEAVGIDDDWLYAATEGRVARLDRAAVDPATGEVGADWETVGEVSGPRRFDGNLLAAASGVVRVGDTLDGLGLADVRDLAGRLAATAEGLYRRRDGEWERLVAGDTTAVIEADGRAFAVVDGTVFDGEDWAERSIPGDSRAVDLAYGKELAVVTGDGTVHVAADPERTHDGHGGWRSQALGLPDVTGFVALGE